MSQAGPRPHPAARPAAAEPSVFASIHALRGIAALLVVCHHGAIALSQNPLGSAVGAWLDPCRMPLRSGVDIFFMISGFVMMAQISRPGPPDWRHFLARRVARIYPLYWLATATLIPSALGDLGLASAVGTEGSSIWLSLLLWPQAMLPLLSQAWTLVHEMVFYLLIAAILAVGARRHAIACVGAAALLGLQQAASGSEFAHGHVFSPRLAEFLAGMVVYRWRTRIDRRAAICCGLAAVGSLAAVGWANADRPLFPLFAPEQVVLYGGPALLVLVCAVGLEGWRAPTSLGAWLGRLADRLGDGSYSIYLFHMAPLAGFSWLGAQLPLSETTALLWVAAAVLAGVSYGLVIARFIDMPMQTHLRRWIAARPSAPAACQRSTPSTTAPLSGTASPLE